MNLQQRSKQILSSNYSPRVNRAFNKFSARNNEKRNANPETNNESNVNQSKNIVNKGRISHSHNISPDHTFKNPNDRTVNINITTKSKQPGRYNRVNSQTTLGKHSEKNQKSSSKIDLAINKRGRISIKNEILNVAKYSVQSKVYRSQRRFIKLVPKEQTKKLPEDDKDLTIMY